MVQKLSDVSEHLRFDFKYQLPKLYFSALNKNILLF